MHIALVPLLTEIKKPSSNMRRFADVLQVLVSKSTPDLVILPECTFTGYLYEEEDLKQFAEPIPGPTTEHMAQLARQWCTSICFGLVERAPDGVFNSAVLLDRDGETKLVHRKVSEKPPYANGRRVGAVDTEFGKITVLICGDLFQDEAIQQVPPDTQLLVVPMARGFDKQSPDSRRWEEEERDVYLQAVERVGVSTIVVNALDVDVEEGSFGGGMVVDGHGNLLAETPHGTDKPLVYELQTVRIAKFGSGQQEF